MDSKQAQSTAWADYYKTHEGRQVSPLLKRAIPYVTQGLVKPQAVDLGCGNGHETLFLLDAGWKVLAIDREPMAIEQLQRRVTTEHHLRLNAVVGCFEELEALPKATLIHAGFSLPFCRPQYFASLWRLIISALEPDGGFVGHLFGDRDEWSNNPDLTFHTADEVAALLSGLDIKFRFELDEDGTSLRGPKHWHRFDIIAKKPAQG